MGERVDEVVDAVESGMLYAGARYVHGDHLTDEQLEAVRAMPRRAESVRFAAEVEDATSATVRVRPGRELDVPSPTAVGLGDTFVGGFLTALLIGDRQSERAGS